MGFFDFLTGAHDPNEDREKSGKMSDTANKLKMKKPSESGNVEDLDMEMLNQMNKGRR
jgi:hypothetical protein